MEKIKARFEHNDLEAARVQFSETGECTWCMGEKELVSDAGLPTESVEVCPVCHPHKDEEADFTGSTNEDR